MAAPNPAQSKKANTGGSSTPTVSFDSLPATGSLIYVHITSYQSSGTTPTISSVADNQGNGNYTLVETQVTTGGSDNYTHAVYFLQATAAPSGTFTVTTTFTASVSSFITIVEVTGHDSGQMHKQVKATGSSTNATATLGATTATDCLILGGMTHNNGTPSITNDATNLPTQLQEEEDNNSTEAGNVAYRKVTSTGTYTGNWAIGSSTTWAVILVAISAPGGGAATPRHLPLLGIGN